MLATERGSTMNTSAVREAQGERENRVLRDALLARHFPVSVDEQRQLMEQVSSMLSDEDLAWASGNRDFAEAQRYAAKDEVDASLVESVPVTEERARIEALFRDHPVPIAVRMYLDLMHRRLRELHQMHVEMLSLLDAATVGEWSSFWTNASSLADIDNAHAMYLSSDNWPFSVFHRLIERLENFVGDDLASLHAILCAGIQDARTEVFANPDIAYLGLERLPFARLVRKRSDWIRSDGVVPLMAFKATTGIADGTANARESLQVRYEDAVKSVSARLSSVERGAFVETCELYQDLYAARAAYDIYEYFGFYGFVRHILILRTMNCLSSSSTSAAADFHHAASTYQFQKMAKVLAAAS